MRALLRSGVTLGVIADNVGVSKAAVASWAHGKVVPEGPRRMRLEQHHSVPADGWTVRPGELDGDDPAPKPGLLGKLGPDVPSADRPAADAPPSIDPSHRGHEEARRGLELARAWLERCEVVASPAEYGRALESYRRATELFARTNGELNASDEAKFLKSQRWKSILSTIVDAIKPVPGALEALARALQEIEA